MPGNLPRALKAIFILLVLATALVAGLHTVSDYDMGWHLATGRWVVEHRSIPSTDVLSFTSAGKPWIYPPFAGVLFYLVYCAFGYAGLSWLMALACLGVVAYLVRRRSVAAALLAMLAVQSIAARIAPRADLFSTVFFALFLGELWSYHQRLRSRLWLLPILMFLWVNLHPGFIAGLGVLAAYLLLEAAEIPFAARRGEAIARLRRAAPWLAATAGATLLNPWGWKIYGLSRMLFGMGASTQGKINSSSFIAEYQAVPISWHLLHELVDVRHMENGFVTLLLIAVCLIGLALWRRQLGAAVVLGAALFEGVMHARYMALFAITVATLGGTMLDGMLAWRASRRVEKEKPGDGAAGRRPVLRMHSAMAAALLGALCALAVLHIRDYVSNRNYIVFSADWRFGAGESSWFPERAAEFIEREKLPGNIFEEYALGGYEAWRLGPKYPDFLDGRSDRLRPDLVAKQRALYTANPDSKLWQSAADRWKLNVVLIAVSGVRSLQKLAPLAFCQSAGWRPVYMDDTGMVFLRNLPQNQPWIDRLQFDCATHPLHPPAGASRIRLRDFYYNSGALLFSLHRDAEAEVALQRAEALLPWDPNVPLLLGHLMQAKQRLGKAEAEYRKSLDNNENVGAWLSLGQLYARQGKIPAAIHAIRNAAAMAVAPTDMDILLAELELRRNRPRLALQRYEEAEKSSPYRNGGESLDPGLYAQIAEGRADAHAQMGNWKKAIDFQKQAIRLTPDNVRRWRRLAYLYQTIGEEQLARRAMQEAAALQAGQNSGAVPEAAQK